MSQLKTKMVRYCSYCGKHLVAVGEWRRNGKAGKKDWEKREFHSKCYKEVVDDLHLYKKLSFGKHKNKTLGEVHEDEPSYLHWMLTIPKFEEWHPCIRLLLSRGD